MRGKILFPSINKRIIIRIRLWGVLQNIRNKFADFLTIRLTYISSNHIQSWYIASLTRSNFHDKTFDNFLTIFYWLYEGMLTFLLSNPVEARISAPSQTVMMFCASDSVTNFRTLSSGAAFETTNLPRMSSTSSKRASIKRMSRDQSLADARFLLLSSVSQIIGK